MSLISARLPISYWRLPRTAQFQDCRIGFFKTYS